MLLNQSRNQIEGKHNDSCNFNNEQTGNVTKLTPNFELKLEINLKEPASFFLMK
jgi:hypothetical protein